MRYWGGDLLEAKSLQGDLMQLPDLPVYDSLRTRLLKAAAYRQSSAKIAWQQSAVTQTKMQALPSYTVSAGLQRVPSSRMPIISVGVSMPLMWFDQKIGMQAAAYAQLQMAQSEQVAHHWQDIQSLDKAWYTWRQAIDALTLMQTKTIPLAVANLRASQIGFEAGKFHVLDVLDAQRTVMSLNASALDLRRTIHLSAAKIQSMTTPQLDEGAN